jgi:hypothetical protein
LIDNNPDVSAVCLNIVGLIGNLAGVILLFRYGMPYRVASGGHSYFITEQADPRELKAERVYKALGFVGLILIIVGTGLQIWATLKT